jgi:hypothetical protein
MKSARIKARLKIFKKIADSSERDFSKFLSQPFQELLPTNKVKRRHQFPDLPFSDRELISRARWAIANKEHTLCDVFGGNCKIQSADPRIKSHPSFLEAVYCLKNLTDWGVEYMQDQNKYWSDAFSNINFTDRRTQEFENIVNLAFDTAMNQLDAENKSPIKYNPEKENTMTESDLLDADTPAIESFYKKIEELAGPNFDHLTGKVTDSTFQGTKELISIVKQLSDQGKKYLHDQTSYQGRAFNAATKSYIRRVVEKAGGPIADSSVTPEFLSLYKKYHNLKS